MRIVYTLLTCFIYVAILCSCSMENCIHLESDDTTENLNQESRDIESLFPSEIHMEEITSLTITGLTNNNRIEFENLTDHEVDMIHAFLSDLTATRVPINLQEYNTEAFICGFLQIVLSTSSLSYSIRADNYAAIYVTCYTPDGSEVYLGKFKSGETSFCAIGNLLYEGGTK